MSPARKLSEHIPEGPWRPACAICTESVEIEESKADEYGQAVHEECYVAIHTQKKPPHSFLLAARSRNETG